MWDFQNICNFLREHLTALATGWDEVSEGWWAGLLIVWAVIFAPIIRWKRARDAREKKRRQSERDRKAESDQENISHALEGAAKRSEEHADAVYKQFEEIKLLFHSHTLTLESTAPVFPIERSTFEDLINQNESEALKAMRAGDLSDVERFLEDRTRGWYGENGSSADYAKLGLLLSFYDVEGAIKAYNSALEIDHDNRQVRLELAHLERRRGDYDRAKQNYEKVGKFNADENEATTDDVRYEAKSLQGLGVLALEQEHLKDAEYHLRNALALYQRSDDKNGMAEVLESLGSWAKKWGRREEAERYLRSALKFYSGLNRKEGIANVQSICVDILIGRGKLDDAQNLQTEVLSIEQELMRKKGIANSYLSLGRISQHKGNLDLGKRHQFRARKLYEELNDQHGIGAANLNLGDIASEQSEYDRARSFWLIARTNYAAVGDAHTVETIQMKIEEPKWD